MIRSQPPFEDMWDYFGSKQFRALGFGLALTWLCGHIIEWDPRKEGWIMVLLMSAVSLIIPAAERMFMRNRRGMLYEFANSCLTVGLLCSWVTMPGETAAKFALPWLLFRIGMTLWFLLERDATMRWSMGAICVHAAHAFPAVGAAWFVVHQANWTPWGFDPLIVLLTAAHFHHAGFTLPLMAGLNAQAKPNWLTRSSCVAILAGVPLVAAGITCTHFGVLKLVEPVGVGVLVAGALGVAVLQIQRGLETDRRVAARVGFVVSGVSLLLAMLLALGFGLRSVFPSLALTMPQMWMIHGTLNAFGFGLCGILAWRGAS